MSFYWPHVLWLLLPVAGWLAFECARRARRAAEAWPKIHRAWAGPRRLALDAPAARAARPRWLLALGLALAVVALARPQWGRTNEPVFDQSREILLALDLSRSMNAPDVAPSRLGRAKLLVQSLLEQLRGERVGLVVFAGTAFLQSPLSADYEILREFLPGLNTDYMPEPGTDYAAMLTTALDAFSGSDTADRYLIILSDGEAQSDGWKSLVGRLREKNIRVIGLGVGTAAGSVIPDRAGGFVKDERGAVVLSKLNSSTLRDLAQATHGTYADASEWLDLPALLRATVDQGRKGKFREKNLVRRVERFQWALAPALVCLWLSFWLEFPVRPRNRLLTPPSAPVKPPPKPKIPIAAVPLLLLLAFCLRLPAFGQDDVLVKPLTTLVGRLSAQPALSARDCAELAQTTLAYGHSLQATQQPIPPGPVRDGLAAADAGAALDPHAADWPQLRQDLADLLKTNPPPPEKKPPPQQPPSDQQKSSPNQSSPQNQNQNSGPGSSPREQNSSGQNSSAQPPRAGQSPAPEKPAPGAESPSASPGESAEPPASGSRQLQSVGGSSARPDWEKTSNPSLVVPLQKLEQVRNQDSPAELFESLNGRQKRPAKTGQDW